ncbi:right-handed parallel beta-helix repeat-containing protein [Streptomyces sp. A3M-1-3]|uniref:right-handed parallel beta-helix repeat-containing protein n=1 Tax=Streptomyces sp. A3M-1-3 TaxID=2962044 RepID=UPI0020B7AADB|nr:right-handed parallel beta-helix repeat-containing protein [Streptomyces sp. A3M-1-3]MCP3819641.1 right-handed parallel beta-helix repeat-containing protein [Streptomyces sp. A3M-1-3]
MTKRQIKSLACIAVVAATGLGAAAPSAADNRHVVRPGESIQKAVNAAQPGDTIVISPGIYRESVLITKSDLTLRGSGASTVIKPGAAKRAPNACTTAGNGICVLGKAGRTVNGVSIRALTLSGFKKSGIWASRTDRLTVRQVIAEKNGVWGIAQERSTRGVFRGNIARDNAESGIFVANTIDREGGAIDTKGAVIRNNVLEGNRIGATVRRVRNLSVHGNRVTGNCGGLFVVGDETKPWAGAMTIRNNVISKNNKFCPSTVRLPVIQGSGIVLTGAEATVVRANVIRDNVGSSPLSGGIVLFKSFVGALNTNNVIRDNVVLGNKTADLANRDTGKGNTFYGNTCRASEPAGMC